MQHRHSTSNRVEESTRRIFANHAPGRVVPFYPQQVTQRGNRRQRTSLGDEVYPTNLEPLSEFCREAQTRVWAHCLVPIHVHLVMVPSHVDRFTDPVEKEGRQRNEYTVPEFTGGGNDNAQRHRIQDGR